MDGTDQDLVKESKASFHGLPYNFETLREPGVIGKALSFDGVNDYVTFRSTPIRPRTPGN